MNAGVCSRAGSLSYRSFSTAAQSHACLRDVKSPCVRFIFGTCVLRIPSGWPPMCSRVWPVFSSRILQNASGHALWTIPVLLCFAIPHKPRRHESNVYQSLKTITAAITLPFKLRQENWPRHRMTRPIPVWLKVHAETTHRTSGMTIRILQKVHPASPTPSGSRVDQYPSIAPKYTG